MTKFDPRNISENDFPASGKIEEVCKFLLNYAILAPSNLNSQPWKFRIKENTVSFWGNNRRWLKGIDPEKREFFVSIGCALENFLIAAKHFGFSTDVVYFPEKKKTELIANVSLTRSKTKPSPLFKSIPLRYTYRECFQKTPVKKRYIKDFHDLCHGDISLHFLEDDNLRKKIDRLACEADAKRFKDPKYREDLYRCFMREGILGLQCLMNRLVSLSNVVLDKSEEEAKVCNGASIFGALLTSNNEPKTLVELGQVFERIYLLAIHRGMALHPMSRIVELRPMREKLEKILFHLRGKNIHQPFCIGFPKEKISRHSGRRPVEKMLIV